ncbi:unnamed protein product [Pleuronectes platessa]|uniref:Uncharacterized protein n=1 Tax=Pleuronectes platessa TaxID=8262 RepID=A0A9N7W3P2_PLEPL|nr:unnamed protein product [Pleuronectes platessa]
MAADRLFRETRTSWGHFYQNPQSMVRVPVRSYMSQSCFPRPTLFPAQCTTAVPSLSLASKHRLLPNSNGGHLVLAARRLWDEAAHCSALPGFTVTEKLKLKKKKKKKKVTAPLRRSRILRCP